MIDELLADISNIRFKPMHFNGSVCRTVDVSGMRGTALTKPLW
jgi:hypothetical protein